ncbi:MAG: hypothetical protein IIB02_01350 [Thaumarchaeota archaeon]|nr:hypothetical protein [Nitrososphaerota archaeon]
MVFGKTEEMDFQNLSTLSFILVLVIATSTIALADDSFLVESFSNSELTENNPLFSVQGHIEDISWVKNVSTDGVIEITGITFSIVNDDQFPHLFEICAVIEGPSGNFTPSPDSDPSCTLSEAIGGNGMIRNQTINFSNGIKVSDIKDLSILIQEL